MCRDRWHPSGALIYIKDDTDVWNRLLVRNVPVRCRRSRYSIDRTSGDPRSNHFPHLILKYTEYRKVQRLSAVSCTVWSDDICTGPPTAAPRAGPDPPGVATADGATDDGLNL